MTHSLVLNNGKLVTPDTVMENASVKIVDGKLAEINPKHLDREVQIIDVGGNYILPGIVDIHTDALDAEIVPRPGADIPIALAFRELERKMSGCGVTTVYHSLHLGYNSAELHSRSKYDRREVFDTVYREARSRTLLNNKIHLRYELSGVDAYDTCFEFLNKGYVSLLSIMDHTPGQGQMSKERFIEFTVQKGKSQEQALLHYEEFISRPKIRGERLEALIGRARELNIPVASHDDDTVEKVNYVHSLGVRICEFPINMATAEHAARLGMHVIGGASNILRGGSLSGNVNMRDAVVRGAVDSLCSDYYPPAILHSIFKLHQEEDMPLAQCAKLTSLNPAKAVGIDGETGSIEEGKDADLLVVKLNAGIPMVTHTLVKGDIAAQSSVHVNYRPGVINNKLEEANA